LRGLNRFSGKNDEDVLWALRDVTFGVQPGEVLGIIGRNGAGKSTLLKVLSRITRPTSGRVTMRGRISSLLEVGTGFHPELTGRENIFLNGAILGMRAPEIRRKLDAIVEFSGVSRFLNTPIKRYSSGMKVRLAFAVAAHLEPEILVIDEVLAVGDAEFQRKCLGTMAELGRSGRTVLFVSHNLSAVQSLCTRGIVLEHGQIRFDGPVDGALDEYVSSLSRTGGHTEANGAVRESHGFVLQNAEVFTDERGSHGMLRSGGPCAFRITICGSVSQPSLIANLWISGSFGERILLLSSRLAGVSVGNFEKRLSLEINLNCLMLMPGHYHLNLALLGTGGGRLASWEQFQPLEVHPAPAAPAVTLPSATDRGVVYAPAEWRVLTDGN
jgi:lipopolysaccharide transport system ATP-binding protein